ncbi:MAG TPA: DUF1697 domain-containing protein [Myxococcota bacterium]|nr:DUF1697 domain-containing protein [Myxococcota bacterium]
MHLDAPVAPVALVALIRAINVGGTGRLPMVELRALCEQVGLVAPSTYIQTGNVIFSSPFGVADTKHRLESALARRLGSENHRVLLRTPDELDAVVRANPFPDAAPSQVLIVFLDEAPSAEQARALANLVPPGREELLLSGRELFIHYPDGMGRSKLVVPLTVAGTGRNLNTVTKLAALASAHAAARPWCRDRSASIRSQH